MPGGLPVTAHADDRLSDRQAVDAMATKADPVSHGEVMRAAVDTAATRLQRRAIPSQAGMVAMWLHDPLGSADLIGRFAESSPAQR
ncbi:MAG TPA: hypothetical protein VF468_04830 [Actinomycetota bacterium]|nr:hypothetical protein [Actinomycetota bacterium]